VTTPTVWQRPLRDDVWLVGARGRLDHTSVPHLESTLNQLLTTGQVRFVVDLSQVDYINSGGLRTLISTWRTVRQQGGDVHLCGLNQRLNEILEMVGFLKIFQTHRTPADAIAAMTVSWDD
jgi:anti-sigma B factor antagonist